MNLVCVSVCVSVHVFSQPPKVPASWNFGSRPNLGQLKTWRSPIFEILIFTDSMGIFRVFLNAFFSVFSRFFRKSQPFLHLGPWNLDAKTIFIPKNGPKKISEKFQFLGHFSGVFFIHKFKNDVFVHDFLSH